MPRGGLGLQLGEQLLERLHGRRFFQPSTGTASGSANDPSRLRQFPINMVGQCRSMVMEPYAVRHGQQLTSPRAHPRRRRRRSHRRMRPTDENTHPHRPPRRPTCAKDSLPTRTPGKLTIATDEPGVRAVVRRQQAGATARASSPPSRTRWPSKLGYATAEVTWTRVTFNNAIAPGAEELRLRHQPVLDHRRAQEGRRLLRRLLRRAPGRRSPLKGSKIAGRDSRSPTSRTPSSAPRSARPATRRSPT